MPLQQRRIIRMRPVQAIVWLSAIVLLVIVLSLTFLLANLRERELEHARKETESLVHTFMRQTEQHFDGIDLILLSVREPLLSEYGRRFALDSIAARLLLGSRAAGIHLVDSLFLVDAKGRLVNSSREIPSTPLDVSDRDYFQAFASGNQSGMFIGKPVRSRLDGSLTLYASRPLLAPDGKLRAVIVAAINVVRFEKLYNYVQLDFDRPLSIYLADGTLIGGVPHRESLIGVRPDDAVVSEFPALGRPVRMVHRVNRQNAAEDYAVGRVNTYPLIVSVTNDERESLASWRETAIPIGLGAICMSAIIVAAAVLLTNQLQQQRVLGRALSEANDRYMQTVDSMMDAIVAVDDQQSITLFNPAAEKMFGMTERQALGSHLDRLLVKETRERHRKHLEGFRTQEGSARPMGPQYEVQGLRSDGSTFYVESTISSTTVGGKKQYTAVLRDVTDRRKAEGDLRELNRQLRGLSASLIEVREQERIRIARELHDDLGQQLTGLKLDLEWVNNRLKGGLKVEQADMDTMRGLLNTAIASVRRISTELRPLILDDLGFAAAIEWQVKEIAKRSALDISMELAATDLVQDTERSSGLFRILQESLTNVIRHAQATHVHVRLVQDNNRLVFSVQDNGKGLSARSGSAGFGLINMRERAIALGGELELVAEAGGGTTIRVTLPLKSSAEPEVSS